MVTLEGMVSFVYSHYIFYLNDKLKQKKLAVANKKKKKVKVQSSV